MQTIFTNLFVYGTLRSGGENSAYNYITNNFDIIGGAKVRGLLYDMGDYPAAVKTDQNHFITGELYQLKKSGKFEWAILQLDEYEEANQAQNKQPLYVRELAEVIYDNTSTLAWMYWYNQKAEDQPLISSGDYFNYKTSKTKI